MTQPLKPFRGHNNENLYLTDNGRCLCGEHLGHTAKATGRDISGQKILRLTPDMLRKEGIARFGCETPRCGREVVS